ncbi:PREDICTED: iroquois-class homeodomain protein IRX-4-like, partial [Priapulus caudatus]|uniref:Iroquois-class homeodomain protein IRX-4-like n=1 Tax=Priapulus caudatus TaxID=37621 RepID=A0ABM1EK11_PRICU
MTWSPRYQSGGDEKNDSDNENDEGDSNNNTSNNDDRTANDSLGSESDTGRDDKDGTMKPCNKNDRGAPTRGAPPRVNALGLSLSHASSAPGSVSSASSDDNSMTSPTGAVPLTSVTHGAMALASGGANDGGTAKPKIWSLAHTATSESPPTMRRSPPIGMPSQLQGMASLNSPVNNLQQWMNGMFHNSHHPAAAAMSRYQILPGINVSSVGGGATGRLGAPNAGLYGGAAAAAIGGIQRLGSFSGTGALQANNQGLPSAAGLGSSALNYAGNGLTATTTLPGGALASGSVGVG